MTKEEVFTWNNWAYSYLEDCGGSLTVSEWIEVKKLSEIPQEFLDKLSKKEVMVMKDNLSTSSTVTALIRLWEEEKKRKEKK
ncbi:MAG: hypothetical protein LBD41_04420 [Clostridiales Family XIII bacterium]|jgi:hypothetical protein|nr:hypothetical protein [Clostridiales Family XIII bacterium]